MKKVFIDEWTKAHKYLTVQLAALLGIVSAAWDYVPAVRDYLDPAWLKYFAVAMIVARVIKQPGAKKDDPAAS
jgi:hypothetical protein